MVFGVSMHSMFEPRVFEFSSPGEEERKGIGVIVKGGVDSFLKWIYIYSLSSPFFLLASNMKRSGRDEALRFIRAANAYLTL